MVKANEDNATTTTTIEQQQQADTAAAVAALARRFPSSTPMERRRFLAHRTLDKATEKMTAYTHWRLTHRLDDTGCIEFRNSSTTIDDEAVWDWAVAYAVKTTATKTTTTAASVGSNPSGSGGGKTVKPQNNSEEQQQHQQPLIQFKVTKLRAWSRKGYARLLCLYDDHFSTVDPATVSKSDGCRVTNTWKYRELLDETLADTDDNENNTGTNSYFVLSIDDERRFSLRFKSGDTLTFQVCHNNEDVLLDDEGCSIPPLDARSAVLSAFSHHKSECDSNAGASSTTGDAPVFKVKLNGGKLPRIVRFGGANHNSDADDNKNRESDPTAVDGRRIVQVLPGLLDTTLAPQRFYALCVAIYLDLKLSRDNDETIYVLVDVRAGIKWPNAPATVLAPFVRHLTTLLAENLPERLATAIVYPIPKVAKPVWRLFHSFIRRNVAEKITILWGPAGANAPTPPSILHDDDSSGGILDERTLEALERSRRAEFR